MAMSFCALGAAGIVNLVNVVQASTTAGLVPYAGDDLNVTLGLFGFLVPMVLAMSIRSLPMYAGLEGSRVACSGRWPGCTWQASCSPVLELGAVLSRRAGRAHWMAWACS